VVKKERAAMKTIQRVTLLVAVIFLFVAVDKSEAANLYGTVGFGGGSSALWGEGEPGGMAAGGTVTYRKDGPSVSVRLAGVTSFELFSSYEESLSEVAVMGGWDFFFPYSASLGLRLGIGRISYHGGYAAAHSWDYEGNGWGPALQFDVYWKRIGFSYIVHTGGTQSFSALLFCFRYGNVSKD
jgi:hypothetical protein